MPIAATPLTSEGPAFLPLFDPFYGAGALSAEVAPQRLPSGWTRRAGER